VGDCAQPGDFLAAVRDGWMVGLSIERLARDHAAPSNGSRA
jgi:hypothetical protein